MRRLDQKVPIRKPPKGLLDVHGGFSVWGYLLLSKYLGVFGPILK